MDYHLACRHHCLSFLVRQRTFPELWLHLWLEVMDQGFICDHKLPENAKLSFLFLPYKLYWIHFWSDPRSSGTQWADTLKQCKVLYSLLHNDAARTLAMVSWVVMVKDLPRQLPVSLPHFNSAAHLFTMLCKKGCPPLLWTSCPLWPPWVLSLCSWGREWLYNGRNCPFYQKPLMINA